MFDLTREIWQTLSNNKLRTALTGVAVAWGIFMLIVLVGMTKGVINAFDAHSSGQGNNTLKVWGGYTTEPWHGYREGRSIDLKSSDVELMHTSHLPHVGQATGEISGSATISTADDYLTTGYDGVYPSRLHNMGATMAAGRFINEADMAQARKVMVLSERTLGMLFPSLTPQQAVGRTVQMNGLVFTVVGVYSTRWDRTSFIPFTTARAMNGNSLYIGSLEVEMQDVATEADGEAVEQQVRATLAQSHEFKPDDPGAVWIWNRFTQFVTMQSGMDILNYAMWVIGLFTLLSGVVGVSNIMFVSVRERTHEIGIRRAIGAKPRHILTQIVLESVAITALFGYLGVLMGIGVTELLAMAFEHAEFIRNPRVDISLALNVTVVLVAAGCLAGLFPALKALKIKPVEALRDE